MTRRAVSKDPPMLAIMQPYLFPYLGYFQLMAACEAFVIYDDVQYMKGGWINRNRIMVKDAPHAFSFSVTKPSPSRTIREHRFSERFDVEKSKFLRTLQQSYARAPFHESTLSLIESILVFEDRDVTGFIRNSLEKLCAHLEIQCELILSSALDIPETSSASDRVIEICHLLGYEDYVNAAGGMELYDEENFSGRDIRLHFLKPGLPAYSQFGAEFVPALSVIDVLMFNAPTEIAQMLQSYEMV